ncbi:unnamed protein product [Miscanthus lutarioriparius]|uniref:Uncharacterized protein n=1 Tax=Miscanthus lutarioriparius TaxID=422564 RepID=A0A811RNG7_9POAL|nr:unnamed protein product [Miscanthus lutarioriparius]
MSMFAGQMSRPWVGMAAGSGTASEPAAAVARDDAAAAAASSMRGADSSTNASAISFGFAATAVLVSMFLLAAIFEHLIKPGLASSSSSRGSRSHDDDDGEGEGRGHGHRLGLPPARLRERDASPDKQLSHSPKVEPVDLTVLMPGQRYPTFLAQPAPLAPCPREGVLWPSHDHRRSFVPP